MEKYQGAKPKCNKVPKHDGPKGPHQQRNRSRPRSNLNTQLSAMGIDESFGGNETLRALECPVCMETMMDNILLCETGHSICHACSVQLSPPLCPVCRSKITLQRNFSLEQMAKTMAVPCNNARHGCPIVTLPQEMTKHFNICNFRQVFCPIGRLLNPCTWHGNMPTLVAHMKENHKDNLKYFLGKEIDWNNFSTTKPHCDIQMFYMKSYVFLFHMNINVYEKVAYFAMQYVGDKNAAEKWKYVLHVYKKTEPAKKMEISDICTSDSSNINDIFKKGSCIGIPLHVLRNYLLENQKLNLKVYINQM